MKKFIPLIMIAGLLACWSCDLKDTYTETNVKDMVNVKDGQLFNDYGYILTVKEDAVGRATWNVEGARYLAIFDILNRDMDISLKSVLNAQIIEAEPVGDPEELAKDPVDLLIHGFSGGYFNVGFTITRAKNSNNAHAFHFYYKIDNNYLTLYVEQEGNGEDPVHMSTDDLVSEDRMFSIPMGDLPYFSGLNLVINYVTTEGGQTVVKEGTINIR
ncbi:MAG: hypothetical protein J5646_06610 [Bacteroidales bacterium]|nr:hypothetical protein [Bacteroidales bacterium]